MRATVLPDDNDTQSGAAEALDAARRELATRPADSNEAVEEFNGDTLHADAALIAEAKAAAAKAAEAEAAELHDGKTARELAREYREAHRQIGLQGAELGEARRKADEIIQASLAQLTQSPAPTPAARDSDAHIDFLADPKGTLERAVQNHPAMQSLKAAATETLQKKAAKALEEEFPEAKATLADAEFQTWAKASPVRMALLKKAHAEFDIEAAREVLGNYKALRGAAPKPSGAKNASGATKIYRRSEIQRLMIEQPKKYEAMADEISRAYQTGRVR